MKDKYAAAAAATRHSFGGICITVTTDGKQDLGAAIGTREYTTTYVIFKIHKVDMMRSKDYLRLQVSILMQPMLHLHMGSLVAGTAKNTHLHLLYT